MTELIRQWIISVTCAAMLTAVIQTLLPKGGTGAAGRLAGGLLLLIATVQPLVGLDYDSLAQSMTQLRLGQTQSYILDKAQELGMTCQVTVTCERRDEGIPFPRAVTVSGSFTQEQADRLSQIIEADLAIPADAQTYEREVE